MSDLLSSYLTAVWKPFVKHLNLLMNLFIRLESLRWKLSSEFVTKKCYSEVSVTLEPNTFKWRTLMARRPRPVSMETATFAPPPRLPIKINQNSTQE